MRLSIESYALREKFDDKTAFRMIREAGFDAVDYSFYWPDAHPDMLGTGFREYAHELRAELDRIGLVCNQTHAPFDVVYGEEETSEHWVKLRRSIEFSAILGAKICVVHSIHAPKGVDVLQANLEFYRKLEPICQAFGVCVGVENLFERDLRRKCFRGRFGTPKELNELVDALNSPYFVTCIDLGHSALTDVDPEDFVRGVGGKRLQALHVQDNDYLDDRHVLPWMGLLDWNAIAKALREIGYTGDITLEVFHYLKRYEPEFLPEVLAFAAKTGRRLMQKIAEA